MVSILSVKTQEPVLQGKDQLSGKSSHWTFLIATCGFQDVLSLEVDTKTIGNPI